MREVKGVFWADMGSVQEYIHDWANRTFPDRAPEAALTKLVMEEIPELLAHRKQKGIEGIGGELADAFILLFDLAQIWGVNVTDAIREKMAINQKRTWLKDHALGHYNHVGSDDFDLRRAVLRALNTSDPAEAIQNLKDELRNGR